MSRNVHTPYGQAVRIAERIIPVYPETILVSDMYGIANGGGKFSLPANMPILEEGSRYSLAYAYSTAKAKERWLSGELRG